MGRTACHKAREGKAPSGCDRGAVMVGQLSVGMETEELKRPSSRVRDGRTSAKARAEKMSKGGAQHGGSEGHT